MMEETLKNALTEYGVKLLHAGLVQGTWGNLSVRVDAEHMLVTPSGIDYSVLKPEDMVLVNIKTLEYSAGRKPTSEKTLHSGIYLAHPRCNAVIHTHSDACSVLAAACAPLPALTERMRAYARGDARVAAYGLPGTARLARNAVRALGDTNACLLAHHGAVCCGEDLEAAFTCCEALEEAAALYIAQKGQV